MAILKTTDLLGLDFVSNDGPYVAGPATAYMDLSSLNFPGIDGPFLTNAENQSGHDTNPPRRYSPFPTFHT